MAKKITKVIAYYRVSTKKQGLGIEAQRKRIREYLQAHPNLELVREFEPDEESGKKNCRKNFDEAIEYCKRSGAALLAANLDRVGRGRFLYALVGTNEVEIITADMQSDSEIERAVRIGMAIEEGKKNSERTCRGLDAKFKDGSYSIKKVGEQYKLGNIEEAQRLLDINQTKSKLKRSLDWWAERNFKAGGPNRFTPEQIEQLAHDRAEQADTDEANVNASAAIRVYLKQGGKRNYSAIAKYLNDSGYKTRRGKAGWKPQSVKNLMERFEL